MRLTPKSTVPVDANLFAIAGFLGGSKRARAVCGLCWRLVKEDKLQSTNPIMNCSYS